MSKLKSRIKKLTAISAAVLAMSAAVALPAKGQSLVETYLAYIVQYTYDTAQATYYINRSVFSMLVILNSWMMPDTSETTAKLQSSFATATNTAVQNSTLQKTLLMQLTQDYLKNVDPADVNFINDFTYQTMLGSPYVNPDPRKEKDKSVNPALNYIKNVAGLKITHDTPNEKWKGDPVYKAKYNDYYATVSAIQTYNSYVLSQMYADATNGNPLSKQQDALMQQASNSDWFAEVASENIGTVLRQILMYNSQTYVLLTQLLQTQKELLSTQAMTNTLLVVGNQFTETQLLSKATGIPR
ncbi:MAG TPA: hypothetical protein VLI69_02665 [Gammaproteobacteria bacterium]|nr:hypothetical protein [Gammaproteobacteria bacterium]